MIPFDFNLRTRIVFGPGAIRRLGELSSELGARRALVVSDAGILAAGHAQRGLDALEHAGIETHLFCDVHQNPTTADVENGVRLARRYDPQLIIGLGGGSSMDCAKGINFVFSNGGRMSDYWGVGKALQPMLPMVAVPTTAGTGSETQSFALISDAETHVKMACGDKKATFRVAILDPELTLTQPPLVTALSGLDALSHAVETFVTTKRNWMSLFYSREAWRLLSTSLPQILRDPADLMARASMQLGACLSGVAIENSMLGATHALANPLTATYGIVHGQAIATMLPHVIRFNAQQCANLYAELWSSCPAGKAEMATAQQAVECLARFLSDLAVQAGLAPTLEQLDVSPESLPALAAAASEQWTASFNPRPVDAVDCLRLYQAAFA
jgi:alcohol dehydrogenase